MPQIRDVMTPNVVTVEPGTSVVDAARTMIQQEKGPLPVVQGGQVVGMVTDRDVIARVVAAGLDPSSVTVDDISTKDLITAPATLDVEEARQMLAQHQIDRLLVVEEGNQLVGIVSEADIRGDEGPLA